jgi:glutamate racemase
MIGIFDSGAGGLSVFKEIRKLLPEESYVYYSDNAHCPYGEKSREYIIDRARFITDFLLKEGADIIIVACNTATAAAISTLRVEYPGIPFIGMEPAIKPAVKKTKTGVVGVLATAGTLKADKYHNTRERWGDNVHIVEQVGKGFVELVEKGLTEGLEAEDTVGMCIEPLLDAGADTIVLGCTHYPFLRETISKVAATLAPERPVTLIDPAPAVARHLHDIMEKENIIKREGFSLFLHASGDDSLLKLMADRLQFV